MLVLNFFVHLIHSLTSLKTLKVDVGFLYILEKVGSDFLRQFLAQKYHQVAFLSHARGYGYAVIILTNDLYSRFSHDERKGDPEINTIFPSSDLF